ncbi:MAG TPA: Ppx/GppA phosphatase family protein [Candidatus Deferrimicrobiaceae bacterium]|jgi:exopolyphosphatase/guanosine-5'-triphosphate,3'-diphosphate pyrophosphatase
MCATRGRWRKKVDAGIIGYVSTLAAIDMGSNAIRFYVVEPTGPASYRVIENIREPIRLGGDVFLSGTIRPENIRKAEEAFRRFRQALQRYRARVVRAVATASIREAVNGEQVIARIEKASGIRVEVIPGDEEARLVALAVGSRIPLKKRNALIVDLGGGSVEVSRIENGRITLAESHNFGAVRLLDVLSSAGDDPARGGALLRDYMELMGRKLRRKGAEKADIFIATGGNMETIASLSDIGAVPHPTYPGTLVLRTSKLRTVMETLSGMTVKARIARYGLREDRADVILPACFVYHMLAKLNGSAEILVPRVSLKDGLILDALARTREVEHSDDLRAQVLVSCRELGERFKIDRSHAEKVAFLATRLFDGTEKVHGMPPGDRLRLEVAALLHDIGYYISIQKHHKHSFYIISNAEIVGFPPQERSIAAHVARYHRKALPKKEHAEFEGLPKKERVAVRRLAALLRLADALDKEHLGAIRGIDCRMRGGVLRISAASRKSCRLESLGFERNAQMFREVFGIDVALEIRKEA